MINPISASFAQYKLTIIVTAMAIAITSSFYAGWKVNGWKHDAELKEQAEAALEQKEAYEVLARELVKRVQEEQAKEKIVYRTIKGKVDGATTNANCFGAGAGKLWNDAWLGMPDSATGTTEEATSTSSFTDKQILNNQIENAEQYKDCRSQVNALIDFYELQQQ